MMAAPSPALASTAAPPEGTVERWAWDYVHAATLGHKLAPPPPPRAWEEGAPARRIAAPGRPPELVPSGRKQKTPGPVALAAPARRAELLHTFLHHELQAAELMCWAILAFPEAPRAFKAGLCGIARDEIRHMAIYEERLAALGSRFGALPVRDWFWMRVPAAAGPAEFVATMGVGFEGANLDHARRFADRFRAVGDEEGARAQERVFEEEIPHVRFARRWLTEFTGRDDFAGWEARLAPPLSPLVMRGEPIQREARLRAGLDPAFVEELSRWQPAGAPGR